MGTTTPRTFEMSFMNAVLGAAVASWAEIAGRSGRDAARLVLSGSREQSWPKCSE